MKDYVERLVENFFAADSVGSDDWVEDEEVEDIATAVTDGFRLVDLGLPSGTLWAAEDLNGGEQMTWVDAKKAIDGMYLQMPTYKQLRELMEYCMFSMDIRDGRVYRWLAFPDGGKLEVDLSGSGWCDATRGGYKIKSNFPYAWWADFVDDERYAVAYNIAGIGQHRSGDAAYWSSVIPKFSCRLCTPPKK